MDVEVHFHRVMDGRQDLHLEGGYAAILEEGGVVGHIGERGRVRRPGRPCTPRLIATVSLKARAGKWQDPQDTSPPRDSPGSKRAPSELYAFSGQGLSSFIGGTG